MNDSVKCCCQKYVESGTLLKISTDCESYSVYGNLNKGEKVVLKYFGKLAHKDNNEDTKIFLNYGYGNLWTDKNILEMNICGYNDNICYCVDLELINNDNLFFCFMDSNNNWDLNDNTSYMIKVEDSITTLSRKALELAVPEDISENSPSMIIKKIVNKIFNLFEKVGDVFDNLIKI